MAEVKGFLGKAGWVKKAPGRLLATYKERFVQVEKTEMVVYEKEDLNTCLERLDLENYERCHELKSPFKKKHRLILIRSNRSGNKVGDVKFQAASAEEKESWIRALSEGIGRAKNKVFDEVKVDDSSNLEHVTRTRPKGNRNRRPPTRIHMKEVADVSSDGILRLDLDLEDAMMPNGTRRVHGDQSPEDQVRTSESSEAAEIQSEKKKIKPPMPPSKEKKNSSVFEEEPDGSSGPEKQVLMPPRKEAESVSPAEETSPDVRKKMAATPPPTPPNKPTSPTHKLSPPPNPPSKETKPTHSHVQQDKDEEKETTGTGPDEESEGGDEGLREEEAEPEEACPPTCKEESEEVCPPTCKEEEGPEEACPPTCKEEEGPEEACPPTCNEEEEEPDKHVQQETTEEEDTSAQSPQRDVPSEEEPPSPQLWEEEKSVDSGQHSDDEGGVSGAEDAPASSAATPCDVIEDTQVRPPKPIIPLKPSSKVKSASIGDLLSHPSLCGDDVMALQSRVFLEMEKTDELLSRASRAQEDGDGPERLLAQAMEKLRRADHVLQEVKRLRGSESASHRKSW